MTGDTVMYLVKHAVHVFSLAVALLPFAEQETEKIGDVRFIVETDGDL